MTRFQCRTCGVLAYREVASVGAHARDSKLECKACGGPVEVLREWVRCDGCGADVPVSEGCTSVGCCTPTQGAE